MPNAIPVKTMIVRINENIVKLFLLIRLLLLLSQNYFAILFWRKNK